MKFKINFFALMLYISILLNSHHIEALIIISAAIAHEAGHILAAHIRKTTISEMKIDVLGARLTLAGTYSYTDEILICLGGPLLNLLGALFTYLLARFLGWNYNFEVFFFSSLSLAITNLLPIKSFDGGRVINCIFMLFFDYETANKFIFFTSFLFLFSIWSASVYLLLRTGNSLSLFVFSISMFKNIFIDQNFE